MRTKLLHHEANFFENKGQWDARGSYLTRQPSLDVWFENRGVDFDYYASGGSKNSPTRTGQAVSMQFVGHQGPVSYEPHNRTTSHTDYLLHGKLVRDVRSYSELLSKSVFPGVDFRGYYADGKPRYDFIVKPNANANAIKLKFVGANSVALKNGSVVLGTNVGTRMHGDLHAYQVVNGHKVKVSAKFAFRGKDNIGIDLGKYDRSKKLVIDPLVYGSYFGGDGGWDEVTDVVGDPTATGGAYLTGDTQSSLFPAIFGPYGFNLKGAQNAFLAKLQGDAFNIDYAIYLGGSQVDKGQFAKLDSVGTLWVVGNSSSPDFVPQGTRPSDEILEGSFSTSGTFALQISGQTTAQIQFNATPAQVDAALSALPVLKGKVVSVTAVDNDTLNDGARYDIKLDPSVSGTIQVISQTLDYQIAFNPFIFALPFHPDATTILSPLPTQLLTFGSPLGTELNGFDIKQVLNQAPTAPIDMVFSGTTTRQIPEMTGVAYPGNDDTEKGFIYRTSFTTAGGYKLNAPFSTYIAGAEPVNNRGVALDSAGNTYVVGTVFANGNFDTSANPVFATTAGVFDGGRLLRDSDIFIRKYSGTNGALTFSALLGGHANDLAGGWVQDLDGGDVPTGSAICLDSAGNIYVAGVSTSFDFPRTRGVYGEVFTDAQNVTVTKLSNDGSQILYSTNLNTQNNMVPAGIAVDTAGDAFVTGNGTPEEVFPEDNGQMPADPDQPVTNLYGSIITTANGLIPVQPAYPTAPQIGVFESWLAVLNPAATNLTYSTYLGGILDTRVYGPYVDPVGDCWLYGWICTERSYVIFSSTGTPIFYRVFANLPASMLTADAFKPYADQEGGGQTDMGFGFFDEFGNPFLAAPPFIGVQENRDGWVDKLRVNLATVQSLTFTPATVPGGFGSTSTGTVTLSSPAPETGATINLSILSGIGASFDQTDPTVGTAQIVIPSGGTTGTFTVFTTAPPGNEAVTIQADFLGSFQDAVLNVVPWLNSFTTSSTSIVGGNVLTGTVNLFQPAPTGGITVTFSTNAPNLLTFGVNPPSITIPAGASSGQISVSTKGVTKLTNAVITASISNFAINQTINVIPAGLKGLSFSPNPTPDGNSKVAATLTLNGQAGSPITVTLAPPGGGAFPAGFVVPKTLVFPTGSTSVNFTVSVPFTTVTQNLTVVASMAANQGTGTGYNPSTTSGVLSVDKIGVVGFTLDTPTMDAGGSVNGIVTISSAAPVGGVAVTVTSNSKFVTVPTTVTILAGEDSATFPINGGFPDVATQGTVTVARGPQSLSQVVTVEGLQMTLNVDPGELPGGQTTQASLTIPAPAPAGGIPVRILYSPVTALSGPAWVTIAEGQTEVDFTVTTGSVNTQTTGTITAVYALHPTTRSVATAQVIIDPVGIQSITFRPSSVHGGSATLCTVTLGGPAPTGGAKIVFSSTNPVLNLPSSITIPAKLSSITFSVGALRVSREISTQVTGTYNGEAVATVIVLR